MKVKLFVFVCLIALCFPAYSQQNDTVWKATLTYCINKEQTDKFLPPHGIQQECAYVYNFGEMNPSGNLKDVISLLKDSISKGKVSNPEIDFHSIFMYPSETVDAEAALYEVIGLSSYAERGFIGNNKIIFDSSALYRDIITGIMMNREWMYNIKERKLSVKTTDAVLLENPPDRVYTKGYGAYEFCSRSNFGLGLQQEVTRPEIVWSRNMSLPIISDKNNNDDSLFVFKRVDRDDIVRYFYYGFSDPNFHKSLVYCCFTTPVKTTFNRTLDEWMWDDAKSGAHDVFAPDPNGGIGKKLTHEEVLVYKTRYDTVTDGGGGESGNEEVIKVETTTEQLNGLEIQEEISFNKKMFCFESKVKYVGLLVIPLNMGTGRVDANAAPELLYWIKFNN